MSSNKKQFLTIDDFRAEAASKLKKAARDYYNCGSDEELTLARNESAFRRLLIRPRCLRDVSEVDTSVEWYGEKFRFPIGIAPTAFHRMAEKNGELSTVRGAALSGSVMIASSWSTTPIEPMAHEAKQKNVTLWFQLYVYKDKSITTSLLTRAQDSGCKAIVLTVDTPVLGNRLADARNGFSLPDGLTFANFTTLQSSQMPSPSEGQSAFMKYVGTQIDPSLNWQVLEWLINNSKLPVIVKGVMRGDDAEEAISRGAKGIIVSNHGGRQMDSAPATVFIDGGIRNGRDVFKAIALGASGVFIGRPVLWGLSAGGAEGVSSVMKLLQAEFEHTMRLAVPMNTIPVADDITPACARCGYAASFRGRGRAATIVAHCMNFA
ncbi:hypothetical protein Y032_0028g1776 [Ancylostoma ceylanicum]|uniref:FMN hydroxy acid dehydrogenase domain-containing protein n=1 Tax=Ancylostoma ceylanicum TaxID=53326 RepID=A0A016USV0_9BILA|nr:hypothetical protein Y032_0028g1776 [Ancylostoma ceylanicum]